MLKEIFSNPVTTAILGALGGIIITLASKFGEGWINEYFENRKRKQELKRLAAKDINTYCVEGMHKNFRWKAKSEQDIKLRATEIEGIDTEVGLKLRQFIDAWSQCRNYFKKNNITVDDEKMAKEYRDKSQELGNELIEIAKEWSK